MTNSPNIPSFIAKTHQLIEFAPKAFIEWTTDGTSFIVKEPKRLEKEVLQKYFNHRNFSSFSRQLSFYGFQKFNTYLRLNSSKMATRCFEYRHKSFIRGRLDLMREIKRKTNGTGDAANASGLKDRLSVLTSQVDQLTNVVKDLLEQKQRRMSTIQTEFSIEPIALENSSSLNLEEVYEFIQPLFN